VELPYAAQKVLVVANYIGAPFAGRLNSHRRRIGCSSFHIHLVLMAERKDLEAQLVIVIGFLALSFLFDQVIFGQIALTLGLVFLISEKLSKAVLRLWWKIAHLLGWINTRILLGLVFYIFLFPIALFSRLFTKDPLSLKWRKTGSAYTVRNHTYSGSDLDNPW
jgi:hypothetical protein